MRVGVSRATLTAQGYPVSDPDGDGLVEIDVIVGADGVARSVQLAAARTLHLEVPGDVRFACFNMLLSKAARALGIASAL